MEKEMLVEESVAAEKQGTGKKLTETKDVPSLPEGLGLKDTHKAAVFAAGKIFSQKQLGSIMKWLRPEKNSRRVDFSADAPAKIRFDNTGLSYAIISKGDQPSRLVPFVWQQDRGTRRTWSVFDWDEFYGKPIRGGIMNPRFTIKVLLIPFDKSPEMCLYYGRGYLAKFDEISEMQVSLLTHDSDITLKKRLEDRSYIAEDLQLYRTLQELSKPKYNWSQILMYLGIGAAVLVVGWMLLTHPDIINQISSYIGVGH